MSGSTARNLVLSVAFVSFTLPNAVAREQAQPKNVTNTLSGGQIFTSYCAPCHGKDAKGGGPTAAALKVSPPDLTTLSKRHNGKFPADYFATVLKNGINVPAHGSAEMPIWGSTFADLKTHRIVTIRVNDLIQYVESMQVK
jgi:mono/diheme cytochrome c family protein